MAREGASLGIGAERCWGEYRQAMALGAAMDRRLRHGHAASGGSRRLGVDGSDLVPGLQDAGEGGEGERGRAQEDDAHEKNKTSPAPRGMHPLAIQLRADVLPVGRVRTLRLLLQPLPAS